MGDQSSSMATPSVSVCFIVIYFLIIIFLHFAGVETKSQSNCPNQFLCGQFSLPTFPFTNKSLPACGLLVFDCKAVPYPTLELGGKQYMLVGFKNSSDTVVLLDPILDDQILSRNCESFNGNSSISFPISPSVSFKVPQSQFLFLFKCNNRMKRESYFKGYKSYRDCKNIILYYKENHYTIPGGRLPKDCSLVQLPFEPSIKSNDLFDELTNGIYFTLKVSKECSECRFGGGQCQSDSKNNSKCLKENRNGTITKIKPDVKGLTKQDKTSVAGENKRVIVIIATVASGGGVIMLMIMLLYLVKTSSYHTSMGFLKTPDERNIESFLKSNASFSPKRFSYFKIKRMTNSFRNKLGQGGYGCVYKGKLPNGVLVAVKLLKEAKGSGEEFINEVASISRTSHINVVTLLGFCVEGPKRALVYEFMPNGSLDKFIYDGAIKTDRQLEWPILYKIAIGIARGLQYLHIGCNTRILHFDIKPHNILLNKKFCQKISDFGLAKLHTTTESFVSIIGARGTIGYVAPEVACRNIGAVSHKSDVYSYGMMVLEMVGGRKNVEANVDHNSEIYFPHWIYRQIELDKDLGLKGIMSEDDKECARKMVVVSLWCIHTDPSVRPSISEVLEMLGSSMDSLPFPPKPYLYYYSSATSSLSNVCQS